MNSDISNIDKDATEKSEQDKRAEEANLMFNISERTILNYLSMHLKIAPKDLFTEICDDLTKPDKPLVIAPVSDYSKNYIAISLKIVPYDYVSIIPDQLKENECINQALGLFYHAVAAVFNSIIAKQIKESAASAVVNASFHLEMDDVPLTFYPIYIYPKRRAELMFENTKYELSTILKNNSLGDKELAEYKEKYVAVCKLMNDIHYDKNKAKETEDDVNLTLKKNNRIGFVVREITEEELENMKD